MSSSPEADVSSRRRVGAGGITPRLIPSWEGQDSSEPSRIYSDATGEGKVASITFLPRGNDVLPALLKGAAYGELNALAAATNPIYMYELFAMASIR